MCALCVPQGQYALDFMCTSFSLGRMCIAHNMGSVYTACIMGFMCPVCIAYPMGCMYTACSRGTLGCRTQEVCTLGNALFPLLAAASPCMCMTTSTGVGWGGVLPKTRLQQRSRGLPSTHSHPSTYWSSQSLHCKPRVTLDQPGISQAHPSVPQTCFLSSNCISLCFSS